MLLNYLRNSHSKKVVKSQQDILNSLMRIKIMDLQLWTLMAQISSFMQMILSRPASRKNIFVQPSLVIIQDSHLHAWNIMVSIINPEKLQIQSIRNQCSTDLYIQLTVNMIEISISQLSLKVPLGTCQLHIGIKCGDKREVLKVQLQGTQKIIKFNMPMSYTFDVQNTKFIQFFIDTPDEQGYVKLLGSSKFIVGEIQGKENSYKIELEHGNILNIVLRCSQEIRISQKQNNLIVNKSEPMINKKRYGSPQPTGKRQPSRSPQHKRLAPQPQPQPVQQLQPTSSNLSKSSASSLKQQKILEDYKQVMQNSVLDESEEYQNSPDQRMDPPQPTMEFKNNSITPRQSAKQFDESLLANYKQMVKQLSLLLDVEQDCETIVHTVQQLLQKSRTQSEQLIKIQCDNQILLSQYTSLQQQKTIIETKAEDFRTQIKQKIKTYKSLFDENVQLKNQLKEDLQKIVHLNLQIKELKEDQQEKQQIDSEIQNLKQEIEKVTHNVDQKQYDYAILTEEINLIQF